MSSSSEIFPVITRGISSGLSFLLLIVSFLFLISACVPSKKFEELQVKYDLLNADYSELQTLKEYCDNQLALNTAKYNTLESEYEKAEQAYSELKNQYKKSKASYAILDQNYKELVIKNENTNNEWKSKNLEETTKRMEGWQLNTFQVSYNHKINNGISL